MEQDSQVVQVDSNQPSNSCQPSLAANTPASPNVSEPDHESISCSLSHIQPSEYEADSISPHDPEYGPDPGLWKKFLNAIIQTTIIKINFLKSSLVKGFDKNGCYIHHLLAAYCLVKSKLSFQNLDSMIGSTVQFV